MTHVPYRGGAPALTDLIGGQVQVAFFVPAVAMEYIRAGKLRALAVTGATPSELFPGLPTLDSFVPGYEASAWFGFGAPKNTPIKIIDVLNKEINAAIANPTNKAKLAAIAATVFTSSPADFSKLIVEETEKWGDVIRAANIKPE
jgi:tripartite-type tricarboxylate transporter receptor subunit TctC